MCFKSKTELFKIIIVLVVLCYTQSSEGGSLRGQTVINKKKISACLNYGHSCLGAHGKRADQLRSTPARDDTSIMDIPIDFRWFLTRLYYGGNNIMDGPELRYQQRQRENIQDLNEYIFSEDDEIKDPSQTSYYQDESRMIKDNQLLKFLVN